MVRKGHRGVFVEALVGSLLLPPGPLAVDGGHLDASLLLSCRPSRHGCRCRRRRPPPSSPTVCNV